MADHSPELLIRGVSKTHGDRAVLEDISFEVNANEIVGLMGPSGGGKTTLLKCINGLERPEKGHIIFEGRDLCSLEEAEYRTMRTRIGYVFQNGALFDSLTVGENLAYPLERHTEIDEKEIARRVSERLAYVGLQGSEKLYPSELSGGMQKRAGLARATMLSPPLILFDEPTAGLDPLNIQQLINRIREGRRTRKMSGIFVAHDPAVVMAVSDRIAILWEGKLHAIGPTEEMRQSRDPIVRSFLSHSYETQEVAG
jgi:phospholipid/cholesterol/gamma-HCH transport system ATP-binding protein